MFPFVLRRFLMYFDCCVQYEVFYQQGLCQVYFVLEEVVCQNSKKEIDILR